MIEILIVDDHVLFREGLASLFRAQPDFKVLGEAGNVQEAVAMTRELKPQLVLMDFSLPDGTGLDATSQILASRPGTQIVFLTMHEDDERLIDAIRSGAIGYLLKNLPVNKLLASLRGISRGEAPLSRTMTRRILEEFSQLKHSERSVSASLDILTEREIEVLSELAKGGTNREIARRLFISENTVKNHVHNILEKLGLNNRREAGRFAQQNGLG